MTWDNNIEKDFGDFADEGALCIPKTPDDVPYSVVKVLSKSDKNPKYTATYEITNEAGDSGRLLLKHKYRNYEAKYDKAMAKEKSVPVVVFNDDGIAAPFDLTAKKAFEAKQKEAAKKK